MKKGRKGFAVILAGLLAVMSALGTAGCGLLAPFTGVHEAPESVTNRIDRSDPEAPTKIESRDIDRCDLEFSDDQGLHYWISMEKRDGWVLCNMATSNHGREDYEASLSKLTELQWIIDKYDLVRLNGSRFETPGIPGGLGYRLYVHYSSGEEINAYDNASDGFSLEEAVALANWATGISKTQWPEIEVTSEDLELNGSWNPRISQLEGHENLSPQVSWEAVPGAGEYAVFMLCPNLSNAMYMRYMGAKETVLESGQVSALEDGEYRGPSNTTGTRRYVIYVYALRRTPDKVPGNFTGLNPYLSEIERDLDTAGGVRGNIIARGTVTGTFRGTTEE